MENKTPILRHQLNERPPALDFSKTKSRTKQSFRDEANINNIMHKYVKTGIMPSGNRKPMYGDFSSGEEFQSIMDRVVAAELDFSALPSDIRDRFGNKATNLLDFLADPANEQEAQELGLLPKESAAVPLEEPVAVDDANPAFAAPPITPE